MPAVSLQQGGPMKHQRGVTITELMIVVIIAGLLAALAAPNLSDFVKNNARTTQVNSMVTALNFARGQAVTRNARVSLCRSTAFADCDGIDGGNFEDGWIVFTDDYVRGVVDGPVDDEDEVLRVFQPDVGTSVTFIGSNGAIGAIGGLSYENTGLGWDLNPPAGVTAVSANTVIRYCDDRGASQARGIAITFTGYPRLTRDSDGDGVDDIGGVELVCP